MGTTSPTEPDAVVQNAIAALRREGLRITVPRRQVINILAHTEEHLTAEDLHERIQKRTDGIHLATIYRTVETLVKAGLVDHIHLPHGSTTYHLVVGNDPSHCHAICTVCDRVIDLHPDLLDGVAAEVSRQHGFELNSRHAALTGRCRDCRTA
jgi:Fur family ferric uptake transcriptional regulator